MTRNVGTLDRIARATLGVVLIALALTGVASGAWFALALVVGVVMLATSALKLCPIYSVLGLKTCKEC